MVKLEVPLPSVAAPAVRMVLEGEQRQWFLVAVIFVWWTMDFLCCWFLPAFI